MSIPFLGQMNEWPCRSEFESQFQSLETVALSSDSWHGGIDDELGVNRLQALTGVAAPTS